MNESVSVFDMLNSETEFARLVSDIHKSAASVQNTIQNSMKNADALDKKSEELSGQIERLEGLLLDLKETFFAYAVGQIRGITKTIY